MKINLTTIFDLSANFDSQIQNLELLKQYLLKNETTVMNGEINEIGEMEKLYLKVSGKTRMNHMDKTLTREQQAELNLKNMGVDVQEQQENLEQKFSYVLPPDEKFIEEKSHDPFC